MLTVVVLLSVLPGAAAAVGILTLWGFLTEVAHELIPMSQPNRYFPLQAVRVRDERRRVCLTGRVVHESAAEVWIKDDEGREYPFAHDRVEPILK